VTAVGQGYGAHLFELTWQLAATLAFFFEVHSDWNDWRRTHELGLQAARQAEDRRGEASMLRGLGRLDWYEGRYQEALTGFQEALPILQELGDLRGSRGSCGRLVRSIASKGASRRRWAASSRPWPYSGSAMIGWAKR